MATTHDKDSNKKGDTSNRGFASMDEDKQKEIASKGGKAAHEKGTAHEFDSQEAREAGKKGGEHSHGGNKSEDRGQRNEGSSSSSRGGSSEQHSKAGSQSHKNEGSDSHSRSHSHRQQSNSTPKLDGKATKTSNVMFSGEGARALPFFVYARGIDRRKIPY